MSRMHDARLEELRSALKLAADQFAVIRDEADISDPTSYRRQGLEDCFNWAVDVATETEKALRFVLQGGRLSPPPMPNHDARLLAALSNEWRSLKSLALVENARSLVGAAHRLRKAGLVEKRLNNCRSNLEYRLTQNG